MSWDLVERESRGGSLRQKEGVALAPIISQRCKGQGSTERFGVIPILCLLMPIAWDLIESPKEVHRAYLVGTVTWV